ncbi:hypothetical protein A3K73_01860 [Candidatus Pacearchaeota archaeon RBG_13_36_9]|nr:MAG: hypothetical protein A3K73_01860 [Candidatus Pacearchaeota archaeon RBG_13_36_9]
MEEAKEERVNEGLIDKRKEKLVAFFKKSDVWVVIALLAAIILGVYIRSLPMQDHSSAFPSLAEFVFNPWKSFSGKPGLWDITTNTWTLGPDLDPWLFLRYAKAIVEEGRLPEFDMMRNVPLGFETARETMLLPYMIAWTYYIFHFINPAVSVDFAGVVFPVVMFALTILSFFFFVREIFIRKDKESRTNANLIALLSTFVMIVIPAFVSRTVAGIPEKESAGFFFMFLAFYFFIKAWKTENLKSSLIIGGLAGVSTEIMAMVWGGVQYIYVTVAIATFLAFILNKIGKREFFVYALWILVPFLSSVLLNIFGIFTRAKISDFFVSLDTGMAFVMFFIMLIDFLLWNTRLKESKRVSKTKIPHNILSMIISIILIAILSSLIFGMDFIPNKLKAINQMFFVPAVGRWQITVAENRQPYFTEWEDSFGPHIRGIALLFWLFFIGSIVLFKKMLANIRKKDAWILTGLYVLFFFGLVFSRYSGNSTFNGENFISKFAYYGAALALIGGLIYYHVRYFREGNKGFQNTDYGYLFLFTLFALCLFSARSAVRVIMVLAPIAPIFLSFLVVESFERFRKTKEETFKIIMGLLTILFLVLTVFIFWTYYNQVKNEAYSFVPSYYNQQWQKAMEWVREETPEDAVFAHWWDYGYWVQSIGNRATVTDGGNAISFWNYWTGRLTLTSPNQSDALNFLYSHNATHFLIDSSDIGKYTAFSSIGSDINYDRYSWIPTMVTNEKQMQETREGVIRIYQGGAALDEDIVYNADNKSEIFLPGQSAAIIGVVVETKTDNDSITFKQPEGVFYFQGQQTRIPLRYLYIKGELIDFKSGINATAFIIQRIDQVGQQVRKDDLGAVIYLSPRIMRGFLGQVYLLDDPLKNFPNFELVHTEPNLIIDNLNSQGMGLSDFVYFQGVQGPIKIWEINYTGEEKFNPMYIDRDRTKYINWTL